MVLLSDAEASTYWNQRHQQESDLRSSGRISFDEAANRMFHMRRLSLLMDLVGLQSSPTAPLFLLDAGCGKGWFNREPARFGHRVDGIDGSAAGLANTRRNGGGQRFHQSSLSGWRSPWLYDVVFCVDVLLHILPDAEWERPISNLASLVRVGGRLIIAGRDADHDEAMGDYRMLRGRNTYLPLLSTVFTAPWSQPGWNGRRRSGRTWMTARTSGRCRARSEHAPASDQ